MTQNGVTEDINTASEHVAAELIGLHSELEILHIPANLDVQKFAERLPDYYGNSFSQEALHLARRLVEEKFAGREAGVTTQEVRDVLLAAVENRNAFLHEQEEGSW